MLRKRTVSREDGRPTLGRGRAGSSFILHSHAAPPAEVGTVSRSFPLVIGINC